MLLLLSVSSDHFLLFLWVPGFDVLFLTRVCILLFQGTTLRLLDTTTPAGCQISDSNLTLSFQRQLQGLSPIRLLILTPFRYQLKVQVVILSFHQLTIEVDEVPRTASFGLVNLLEQLTELRETFYSLDYRFIMKGYNSRTARQKRCIGQGMGKRWRAPMLSQMTPLSPNLHVFTSQELLGFYGLKLHQKDTSD